MNLSPSTVQMSVDSDLANMSPAYFGMVMATGIVSLAAYQQGILGLAQVLFYANIVFYAVLWMLTVLRAVRYPHQFLDDMIDHLRGPGFFTMVAATSLIGSQAVVLNGNFAVGMTMFTVAVGLWVLLTYTVFTGFIVKETKPTLDKGINGAWLLAVVASQSLAVLGTLVAAHIQQPNRLEVNFLALSMWLLGGMLYIWTMSLIFYRYTMFRFSPADLSPPYWINMGAMAISTLAGSMLILNAPDAWYLRSLEPFIKGFTVFYWATGTWWIPMLLVLAAWRHIYRRFPLRYDPLYWGAVFPLGMYSAGTHQMLQAMDFGFLWFLPQAFFWVALVAWSATFLGLARQLMQLVAARYARRS